MTRQKLNQVLALALAAVLTVGLLPIQASAASVSFTDVSPSAWYYEDVTCLADKGVVSGVGDNKFEPEREVANCEMLQMVINSFFKSDYDAYEAANYNTMQTYFGSNTYWFSFKAYYASEKGLLDGINMDISSYTSCYQPMSRYDMALILTNAAKAKGIVATEAQKTNAQSSIADYASIPAAYQDAAKNCFALGLLNGKNGAFAGSDNMTRAEACAVIVRLEKLIANGIPTQPVNPDPTPTPDPTPEFKDVVVTTSTNSMGTSWTISDNGFGTGRLNNGKAITEENIIELLNETKEKWPHGMTWGESGTANNNWYANPSLTIPGLRSNYACSGFASMLSDYIFGHNGNPARQVYNFEDICVGDVIIMYNSDSSPRHAKIVIGINRTSNRTGCVFCADGNVNGKVYWDNTNSAAYSWSDSDLAAYGSYAVYTRWP